MSSLKVALCAGAAALTAALCPTAHAADGEGGREGVSVTPSTPSLGSEVSLEVSGCRGTTGTAASAAFVSSARLVGADGSVLAGETRIRTSLRTGSYGVTITCADFRLEKKIVIVAGPAGRTEKGRPEADDADDADGGASDDGTATGSGDDTAATPASPVAPVLAGGGGAAPLASGGGGRVQGPGAAHAVTGLVLAGAATVAVALRTVRRRSGAE
ncbi:hypothetical protein ABZ330_23225 [Streptomyces sp. NPDC006172]|uniref:hypothetical protein n=1 Tax=Streptomyces sp. NPDC006172 TaxID=3154470 RepID=UPI0033EF81C6